MVHTPSRDPFLARRKHPDTFFMYWSRPSLQRNFKYLLSSLGGERILFIHSFAYFTSADTKADTSAHPLYQ